MMGTSLHFGRGHGEIRFYDAAKARRSHRHQNPPRPRSSSGGVVSSSPLPASKEPESRVGPSAEPSSPSSSSASPVLAPYSNLDSFLEATAPSVPAQYLPKTRMRGWRNCDVECSPYFTLGDLWESFKEWSAYGAGVRLVLNGSNSVDQYYVPYLSAIQLYGESSRHAGSSRRPGDDSDVDGYRDSSSDGSSDCELERGLLYAKAWSGNQPANTTTLGMDGLSLSDEHVTLQEGFSSDDSEAGNSQGSLIFQFLERDPPYSRVPLADKVTELARCFPELRTFRSCDLLPASWISVAWYPIYRIPTGPTLKDLDACFLTFHYLSTQMRGAGTASGPKIIHPQGVDSVPKVSLPAFGLASYKFKSPVWIPGGGCKRQLATSLLQAADNWLRLLNVDHPDYRFFASHGVFGR